MKTPELSRISALASRHKVLGSELEDWNGMGTAWSYSSEPNVEHDAIRESAGMFDMSGLKKVHVRGADSLAVVDHAFSRDMTKVKSGECVYGSVLTDKGTVCDDAIVYNNGSDEWLFVHGSGDSMQRLTESAQGKNVSLEMDDSIFNIAVQGPKSLALLKQHTSCELDQLGYFRQQKTEIFGKKCLISRTGYSGERGYEIFTSGEAICEIWDEIVKLGVMPCSFASLDKVRVEAALLFFGYDMTDEQTPWEVGLGFTVCKNKGDYRGKSAVLAAEGKMRFKMVGLVVDYDDALVGGEALQHNGETVGVVNSPVWSHRMNKSLALAHIRADLIKVGTHINVQGEAFNCNAVVAETPFYDAQKLHTHS